MVWRVRKSEQIDRLVYTYLENEIVGRVVVAPKFSVGAYIHGRQHSSPLN